jgi:tRNA uridine 5-carbamoylmethylation protein Kti12
MKVIIINGNAGVGKDTFVGLLDKQLRETLEIKNNYQEVLYHTSIINPVKKFAYDIGWAGRKTEKDRKFLSDLKDLIDNYNDFNYNCILEEIRKCNNRKFPPVFFCVDMRSKEDIDRLVKDTSAIKVLVENNRVNKITSNHADNEVNKVVYDYIIKNNGTLEELKEECNKFITFIKSTELLLRDLS